ncbi:hypothetical protein, partial [Escherichia sp. WS1421]|uniref:hypothetical protein n=1 Tax=Escherichia sp. WS1421 TaxID=3381938 RepID=UPI00396F45DC
QNDVTLKMPAFEWVHVQLHQQKGMISLSPPTICNSALCNRARRASLLGDGGVKPTRNRVMNLHRDSQSAVS